MSVDTKRQKFQTYGSRQTATSLELSGEYQRLEGVKEIRRLADEVDQLQKEVEVLLTAAENVLSPPYGEMTNARRKLRGVIATYSAKERVK